MDFKGQCRPEYLEKIKKFRLIDDEFLTACFQDNIPAVQLVLRIILNDDKLVVTEVKVQHELKNIYGKSVRFDIHAIDGHGRHIEVEVQRDDKGATPRRARYNSGVLDANTLRSGQDYEQLPDNYLIVIAENDVLDAGLQIYHISRIIEELGTGFNDGSYIIYVNAGFKADNPLGLLMQDFYCTEPEDMHYKELADRAYHLKRTEEGVRHVSKIIEDLVNASRNEGKNEGRIEQAIDMMREDGKDVSEIISYLKRKFGLDDAAAQMKLSTY